MLFINHYECPKCGRLWDDEWEGTPEDECAACHLKVEPYSSDDSDATCTICRVKEATTVAPDGEFVCEGCLAGIT